MPEGMLASRQQQEYRYEEVEEQQVHFRKLPQGMVSVCSWSVTLVTQSAVFIKNYVNPLPVCMLHGIQTAAAPISADRGAPLGFAAGSPSSARRSMLLHTSSFSIRHGRGTGIHELAQGNMPDVLNHTCSHCHTNALPTRMPAHLPYTRLLPIPKSCCPAYHTMQHLLVRCP